ncbi:MAG: polysaccharide deacetylase family protein [Methylotenera sp.]
MSEVINKTSQAWWRPSLLIIISAILHVLLFIAVVFRPDLWKWLFALLISNHLLIAMVGLWPRSNWLGPNWTKLPAAAAYRNEIALTIDDGPEPTVTPKVLELLDSLNVKATFFCIGDKVAQHPELCREMIRRGHAIENHSQQHKLYFSLFGTNSITHEIVAAQETIANITGIRPGFFRAPAGLRNLFLDPVLNRLGLRLASWTIRGFDTKFKDAEKVKNKLLSRLHPGAILLLHDGNAARTKEDIPIILAVLPSLLAEAKKANLHFVTLKQASL